MVRLARALFFSLGGADFFVIGSGKWADNLFDFLPDVSHCSENSSDVFMWKDMWDLN